MKKKDDATWLQLAVALSKKSKPANVGFCVGAVIVDKYGNQIAEGYSRETDHNKHAEEIAIERAKVANCDLHHATLYSSLEPCGERLSGRKTCVAYIIENGIPLVVFGAYEPSLFVEGKGEELLQNAGIVTRFIATDQNYSIK
jgi:diaminohydroxyphosphoribosylaminopyrimidine deaminase/5-amino-6-(5-phosphoribosylamino)uracil reductase